MIFPRVHAVCFGVTAFIASAVSAHADGGPLSLDTPWSCSAGSPISDTADKTEGAASQRFQDAGYSLCESASMTCESFPEAREELLFDVKLPAAVPNPWWIGDLSLYAEVPSAGLHNDWVGNALLNELPLGVWTTVTIPATANLQNALEGSCNDVVFRFALNTSAPDIRVDNIRFAGDQSKTITMTITDTADDTEFDPSFAVINGGWNTVGESPGFLMVGAYDIDIWGGQGNGLTTGSFRFTLPEAIPAGTTVSDARLTFWGNHIWDWDETDALQIAVENVADAAQVTGLADLPLTETGRPILPDTIRWPAQGGLPWTVDGWNESVDISPLIQDLVDTYGGLASGAHIQVYIYGIEPDINSEVGIADVSYDPTLAPVFTVTLD